jgi:hypothetical protein
MSSQCGAVENGWCAATSVLKMKGNVSASRGLMMPVLANATLDDGLRGCIMDCGFAIMLRDEACRNAHSDRSDLPLRQELNVIEVKV